MRIGFGAPVSGAWSGPDTLARFAVRAEELGYASLWTYHRLLVPADAERVPSVYHSVLDPLQALAFVAAHTSRIRLGVGVLNLPFLSPAYLAKEVATLDVLSGGRVELGLGLGWQPEEFTATGASTRRRGPRAVEFLRVLRTLWADEVSEFDGEFYTVPPSRMLPKPVQRPGPPVLLGGMAPAALDRAGRIADGLVLSWTQGDPRGLRTQVDRVRAAATAAGRDPDALRFICRGVVHPGPAITDADRAPLSGSYRQIRADADWLATQGVTELFFELNHNPDFGSPDADRPTAIRRAEETLHELAPTA